MSSRDIGAPCVRSGNAADLRTTSFDCDEAVPTTSSRGNSAGVAQAAPASFPEDPTGWMWTPERNALLRKLVADGMPRSKCIAPLNTLPGKPFTKFQQIAAQMSRLGIRLSREHYGAATRAAAVSGAAARAVQLQRLTPERMAYMREAYPAGVPVADMLEALNAMPGPAIASIKAVRHHLGKQGLFRPTPDPDEAQQRSIEARRAREAKYRARVRAAKVARTEQPVSAPRGPWRAAAPTPPAVTALTAATPSPEIADAVMEARYAKAWTLLIRRVKPSDIVSKARLPLREVLRLKGELRRAACS